MKKHIYRAILALLTFVLFGILPSSAQEISKGSNWGFYLDMEKYKESAIFKATMVLDEEGRFDPTRKFLMAKYDFDPRVDLVSLTAYGNGKRDHIVVVVVGNFQKEKIISAIGARKEYKKKKVGGNTCHSFIGLDKKIKHFSFKEDDVLVMASSEEGLFELLEMGPEEKDVVENKVKSSAEGEFVLGVFMNAKEVDLKHVKSGILSQMSWMDFILTTEEDGIRFAADVQTKEQSAAQDLYAMANGAMAMARMNHGDKAQFNAFFQNNLKFKVEGNSLMLSTKLLDQTFIQNVFIEMAQFSKSWRKKKK